MAFNRNLTCSLVAVCLISVCTLVLADYDVRVIFFNQPDLDGTSATYKDKTTDTECTKCRNFGGKGNSWVSYALVTPVNTPSGNYSLWLFDGDKCDNSNRQSSYSQWGNFSTSLGNNVDSWKICPPGHNP